MIITCVGRRWYVYVCACLCSCLSARRSCMCADVNACACMHMSVHMRVYLRACASHYLICICVWFCLYTRSPASLCGVAVSRKTRREWRVWLWPVITRSSWISLNAGRENAWMTTPNLCKLLGSKSIRPPHLLSSTGWSGNVNYHCCSSSYEINNT